jgi:uncharacterized membrane protein
MNNTKNLVLNGLMIALVCVSTMVIQIPIPGTSGYVNVGDSIIFISSVVLGPIPGMIAGGIGSAFADVLSGYTHWAPFTLIIKGFEGLIVGLIYRSLKTKGSMAIAMIVGIVVMVGGYLIGGFILKGSWIIALGSIPANSVQGVISMVIALPFSYYVGKAYNKNFLHRQENI